MATVAIRFKPIKGGDVFTSLMFLSKIKGNG
jgi:hypothetical protein